MLFFWGLLFWFWFGLVFRPCRGGPLICSLMRTLVSERFHAFVKLSRLLGRSLRCQCCNVQGWGWGLLRKVCTQQSIPVLCGVYHPYPSRPYEDGALCSQRPQGQGDGHREMPSLTLDKTVGLSRWTARPPPGLRMQEKVFSPLVKNVRMLVKKKKKTTPLWIVLFASVYYQTPLRGSQGRSRMSEVGPGNFLPQRLCFLSLLLLKGHMEACCSRSFLNPFSRLPSSSWRNHASNLLRSRKISDLGCGCTCRYMSI